MSFFAKSRYLSKMASTKTNKIKQTPFFQSNFSDTTFLLGLRRFIHSKGPLNAPCPWLRDNTKHCIFSMLLFDVDPYKVCFKDLYSGRIFFDPKANLYNSKS